MNIPSRRRFVLQAAALAAAPFISAGVARSAGTSGKKLGFALCGLGSLSANQIAPALHRDG